MKKWISFAALMASICCVPAPASAITDLFYGKVFGGPNFFEGTTVDHEHLLMGPVGGIAVGYDFYHGFMMEVEMSMRRNSTKHPLRDSVTGEKLGGDRAQTYSWMGNFYYEKDFCWIIKPYIGAGIGYDQVDQGPINKADATHKTLRNGFAYQGMVGFNYTFIDERMDIGFEYRYHRYRGDHYYSNSAIVSFRQFL